MQVIEIGASMLKQGVILGDNDSSNGISPKYKGHNFFKGNGIVMYPQPAEILATISAGNEIMNGIVARIINPVSGNGEAILIDADKYFYKFDNDEITRVFRDTTAIRRYGEGQCDIKFFKNEFYISNNQDIVKMSKDMATRDLTWWTVTMSKTALQINYNHPMAVVEDGLFVADRNAIHLIEDATTVQYNWMELPDTYNITAMKKSPSGAHLLAFVSDSEDLSHAKKSTAKCFVIDTNSGEFISEPIIDDQVEGVIVQGGVLFLTSGKNFGYWNGAGIKTIREFSRVDVVTYNNKITTMGGCVLVLERLPTNEYGVLAYGSVDGGRNIFFYPFFKDKVVNMILTVRPESLLVCYYDTTYKIARIDFSTSDVTNAGRKLATSKKVLGTNNWVRRVDLYTETVGSNHKIQVSFLNRSEVETLAGTIETANESGKTFKRIDCNIPINDLQTIFEWNDTNALGLKKALVYVESE